MHMPPQLHQNPILAGQVLERLNPAGWPLPPGAFPQGTALVGGAVRDALLNRLGPRPDLDLVVSVDAIGFAKEASRRWGGTCVVLDADHGIARLVIQGWTLDLATQEGGSLEADLGRRDFTVNAIAYDPFTDTLIDPHGGATDLQARVLRHTSAAFGEDPLRVLRAMQFAARFDFSLAPETATLSRQIADTFWELPVERVWGEWDKWATKASKPSQGLIVLKQAGWLHHFPEIAALDGVPQEPEWHPEGDVFIHTGHCLDALVGLATWRNGTPHTRRILSLSVLGHDFGKALTTKQAERRGKLRWTSPETGE